MASVRSYRDLIVWQEAMSLAKSVYKISANFPRREVYGLTSQIRRASISIPSNIAEGHARDSTREYLRFVSITLGSLAELETQLCLAAELEFCTQQQVDEVLKLAEVLGRRLHALQSSLNTKVN
jgi:four helix bundle protein